VATATGLPLAIPDSATVRVGVPSEAVVVALVIVVPVALTVAAQVVAVALVAVQAAGQLVEPWVRLRDDVSK